MGKSLVLNITNVPLSVVAQRRATMLVIQGKADSICESEDLLRSEHLCLQVPSVIRLKYFIKVPNIYPRTISRRSIFARDGHRCQYCGSKADSIDHIIPKSRGGKHVWENVVAACRDCNSSKQDHLLSETSLKLNKSPRVPQVPGHATFFLPNGSDTPKHWFPFLVKS